MPLTFLHTAEVHRATFDTLASRHAPGIAIEHVVRPDWLTRAQAGGDPRLASEIAQAIADADSVVVCTCSTIGTVAEDSGAIRIDRPMMARAAQSGGRILLAYALDSTLGPSTELLQQEIVKSGKTASIVPLNLTEYWPLFIAGEVTAFAACIAAAVRHAHQVDPANVIVLAQVSMAGAAAQLESLGRPVLTSPELAFQAAIANMTR